MIQFSSDLLTQYDIFIQDLLQGLEWNGTEQNCNNVVHIFDTFLKTFNLYRLKFSIGPLV